MFISKEQSKQVIDYFHTYGSLYNKNTLQTMINDFDKDISYKNCCHELMQVYSSLDVIPNRLNIYKYVLQYLTKNFDLKSNILEINGGPFPLLGKYIAKEQVELKKGKITVYDPYLIIKRLNHVILSRRNFNLKQDISNYDLLISMQPGLMADNIIKQANTYHKELFLICTNKLDFYSHYPIYNKKSWENYIDLLIHEDEQNFIINKTKLPQEFGSNYFILTKKKKCNKEVDHF